MPRTASTWRRIGFYVAAALSLALVLAGLGEMLLFGLVGWLDPSTLEGIFPGAEPHRVHGLAHGLFAWMLALAIAVLLWRPRATFAAAVFGLVALSIYTLAALVSGTFDGLEVIGIVALGTVVWLDPGRGSGPFLPVRIEAIALASPLLVWAVVFAGLQIDQQLSATLVDPHAAIGHYGVMAAMSLTIAAAAAIASSSLPGATTTGWLGAAGALWIGLASILFPASASSLGVGLGIGVAVAGLASGLGLVLAGRRSPMQEEVEPRQAT